MMTKNIPHWISIDNCKHGYLYKISSRNLSYGVYNKEHNGFIGIREKFGSKYLFMEHHWDNESFATAKPLEEIEKAPDDLMIKEDLGVKCGTCNHPIDFDLEVRLWVHTDGAQCDKPYGQMISNVSLFNYLAKFKSDMKNDNDKKW